VTWLPPGELPFAFMDAPTMGAQPHLPTTYEEDCARLVH
jgi:hypothetical protein